MYPNMQAYDRGAMFSPDGRLFQVDYAREAVRKGATSLGLLSDDAVVLIAHKSITEPLAIPSTVQKIFRIDANIGVTYSGLVSDGLHLINIMRVHTQTHRMVYNETESVEAIAKEVSEEMQVATQYGGLRPYAISLLIGGYDNSPKLYEIDAGASFLGYMADAIGQGKIQAQELLTKEYKTDMSVDDTITLGISVIKKVVDQKINELNMDIATISKDEGYSLFSPEKIKKYL
ncbi:MAG: archaeal proteasome endopeptidase complex subunit alpha [Candidatus Marsarchaeota archaeon]|jgi:proteasome alpha subunit|nr:archaeal proteasome endopeptidase complex subunit alpha [Candidatus Marsarchaeota archaeon]